MSEQIYTDPRRAHDPHALPDAEVFFVRGNTPDMTQQPRGWYWWAVQPGCLPDSDAYGPFATKASAIADAQHRDD